MQTKNDTKNNNTFYIPHKILHQWPFTLKGLKSWDLVWTMLWEFA